MKEAETKRAPKLTVEQKKYLENGILIKQVEEIWESFDAVKANRYCGNYYKRLQAVIKAQGGYTKY
jgi:hypothetical protein